MPASSAAAARGPAPYDTRPPRDDYPQRERRRDWDDDDDDDHYRQRGDQRYHKKSGFGRELGLDTLELYLETKSVIVSTSAKPFNPFGL